MTDNTNLAISLILEERQGRNRLNESVALGIPFPKGALFDPFRLELWDTSGKRLPLQRQVLARWIDGSAKWVLLDFQATVDARTQAIYHVRTDAYREEEVEPPTLSVVRRLAQLVVDTGKTKFFINRRICKPFDRMVASDADLMAAEGSSLLLIDPEGLEYLPYIEDLAIEASGPIRATIRVRGEFKSESGNVLARFVVRLNFHAGSGFVEMTMTLHNPRAARHPGGLWDLGDEGSVYFKDLSFRVPLREQAESLTTWTTQPFQEGGAHSGDRIEIYQDSSGGENWRSTNHANRFGKVMHSFRGYRVKAGDVLVEEGLRARPTVATQGEEGGIAGAIEKFWQNSPKAIESDENGITLRLFPRQYNDVFELQGGEQKTHTMYLHFYGPGETQPDLSWVHDRLTPAATPEWYSGSTACSYLSPRSQDKNVECLQLIDSAIHGPQSFFARREIIDEYGWRNFGDLYADHEAVGHKGHTPLVAHYNNQYDAIYGALVQYLRGGDKRWFDLASDLARHVIDIDIYHTEKDRPAYNGGLFWHTDHYLDAGTATHRTYSKSNLNVKMPDAYGGGPCNEHNYTTGLLHYYYLTGDETAREAVLSLADWVINMDTASHGFIGCFDKRATGLASSTMDRWYHGPGRGAGNSINALIDGYALTHDRKYLVKADQLIRRCIHPDDDIPALRLDDPEHRWSYLVFLQVLDKYLDIKIDAEQIDFMYRYVQGSLLHYADWMLTHEVPYATVLDKVEIPTETWSAQDIRKSVVFDVAAKYASKLARSALKQKAEYFFETCIRDLRSFPTCTLTRPIVLLLSNGYIHSYFVSHPEENAPAVGERGDFGHPQSFRAQFSELCWARRKIAPCLRGLANAARSMGVIVQKRQITSRMQNG